MPLKFSNIPLRAATGAFILNSGLSKLGAGREQAQGLHGFAATAFPQVKDMEPQEFVKLLSRAEIALGTALLLPFIPSRLAGLALTAFAGGLNWLYYKAPGLRQEGSLRPTEDGIGIAKDLWMTAMGVSMLVHRPVR